MDFLEKIKQKMVLGVSIPIIIIAIQIVSLCTSPDYVSCKRFLKSNKTINKECGKVSRIWYNMGNGNKYIFNVKWEGLCKLEIYLETDPKTNKVVKYAKITDEKRCYYYSLISYKYKCK